MVTTLPPPEDNTSPHAVSARGNSPLQRLSLIPPERERIVSAIEKIYKVLPIKSSIRSQSPDSTISIKTHQSMKHEETTEIMYSNTIRDNETQTCPDSILPSFHSLFQVSSSTNTEYNLETYNSPAASDSSSTSNFATYSCSYTYEQTAQYEMLKLNSTLPEMDSESPSANHLMPDTSDPGASTAGVKRPNRFDDQQKTNKKKVLDADETVNDSNLSLETFFHAGCKYGPKIKKCEFCICVN